jgi:large subunit ribosomal protein L4e
MTTANVHGTNGSVHGSVELPQQFHERVREDLIRRAVLAENSLKLQPQGHSPLAGMNTTARYYGAMNSYRTGRHMGRAMRPRQKLAGGRQGDVRRIPSGVKGRRATPHMIEKTLIENINRKEYQKAVASAIAATASPEYVNKKHAVGAALPLVVSNDIENVKKTKEMLKILGTLKLGQDLEKSDKPSIRKGLRRLAQRRHYRRSVLIVLNEDRGAVKAARNIPGVDACTVKRLKAGLLAPGGHPGRLTLWSESAVKNIAGAIAELSPGNE